MTEGLSGHKAPRIKRVMREVVRRLPDVPIAFVDHLEDSDAIGIAVEGQPERLVYVCTAGSPTGRYYADIEFPPKRKGGRPSQQGPSFESLGMDELVALVCSARLIRVSQNRPSSSGDGQKPQL